MIETTSSQNTPFFLDWVWCHFMICGTYCMLVHHYHIFVIVLQFHYFIYTRCSKSWMYHRFVVFSIALCSKLVSSYNSRITKGICIVWVPNMSLFCSIKVLCHLICLLQMISLALLICCVFWFLFLSTIKKCF